MMSAQLQRGPGAPATPPSSAPTSEGAASTSAVPTASEVREPLQNRAGESNSPYIRRHADTPVAWQFLDKATLSRARDENKPIFMHIGFLADHHCRLTTQDSFSNPTVASFLNEAFIPIIIDRDERPDLDTIYQNYSEAVNATGGWPLNLFLTPDLYPIFGGTYWPGPGTEHSLLASGAVGDDNAYTDFLAISRKIHKFWVEQEERCRKEAFEMLSKLQDFAQEGTYGPVVAGQQQPQEARGTALDDADLDLDQLEEALGRISRMFDPVDYGFGTPKFPNPARLSFLLRLAHFPQEVKDVVGEEEIEKAAAMALGTLRRIRDRCLRDHLGAGFMRFSVTRDWSVPHFEKMVGENALLLGVYLDAWLGGSTTLKADDEFADVVFEVADYLISPEVHQPGGGFITSEVADSFYRRGDQHEREGAYYLWTRREFDQVVDGDAGDGQHASLMAAAHWNVHEDGNVPREQDPHDEFINQNVLCAVKDAQELSRQFGIPTIEVQRILLSAREKLRAHRERERTRPIRDEKIIVGVNGIVLGALARTAAAVQSIDAEKAAKYLQAAKDAAAFVKTELTVDGSDGTKSGLRRFYFDGPSETRAFADDYAFLIEGLLDLYDATLENVWLDSARQLQEEQLREFYDYPDRNASRTVAARRSYSGGFYSTEEATLCDTILRLKSGMDKSQPSTNAVSASNLFRLGTLLANPQYIHLAKETISAFESEILQYPWLFVSLLTGVVSARLGVKTIRVVSEGDGALRSYYTSPRAEAAVLILEGKPKSCWPSMEGASERKPDVLDDAPQSNVEQPADNLGKVEVTRTPQLPSEVGVETRVVGEDVQKILDTSESDGGAAGDKQGENQPYEPLVPGREDGAQDNVEPAPANSA